MDYIVKSNFTLYNRFSCPLRILSDVWGCGQSATSRLCSIGFSEGRPEIAQIGVIGIFSCGF
jgi:hypothetical protein